VASLKTRLWRGACRTAYWSGVGPLLASSRRRAGTWTVLTYHRIGVAPPGGGEAEGPDLVSPARFRAQIRWLRRHYEVLPVGEAFERMRGGGAPARPLASITFDDGYRDNVDVALPILRAEGCRATLYVTVEAVREGLPPWTHRLARDLAILAAAPGRANGPGGQAHPLIGIVSRRPRERGARGPSAAPWAAPRISPTPFARRWSPRRIASPAAPGGPPSR